MELGLIDIKEDALLGRELILTKTDLIKVFGVTPPEARLVINDFVNGVRIIIEPYVKGHGIDIEINKSISLKQLSTILKPKRVLFNIPRKFSKKYRHLPPKNLGL